MNDGPIPTDNHPKFERLVSGQYSARRKIILIVGIPLVLWAAIFAGIGMLLR